MVLDKRQSELGKREQEAESLRQQIERLNADLQDARQASENPMQELGTSLGKEFQTLKNTYEAKKREELEHARTQAEQILQQAKDESQKRLDSTTETTKQMMTAAQDKKQKLEQDCAKLEKETDDKVAIQLDTAKRKPNRLSTKRNWKRLTGWTRRRRKSTPEPRRPNSMPPNWIRTVGN